MATPLQGQLRDRRIRRQVSRTGGTARVNTRPVANRTSRYAPTPGAQRVVRTAIRRGEGSSPGQGRRNAGAGGLLSGGNFARSMQEVYQGIFADLMADFSENRYTEQAAVERAYEAEQNQRADLPWWDPVLRGLAGPIGGHAFGERGFADSLVGRGIDIISRPTYAAFEAMRRPNTNDAPYWSLNPSDIWEDYNAAVEGAYEGFIGKEKTGFGDVYEQLKNNPTNNPLGQGAQNLERSHPAIEQTIAIGVGAAGEFGLDPLNWWMPAAPLVLREGAEAGQVATERTLVNYYRNAIGQAVDDSLSANPNLVGAQNPQSILTRVTNSTDDLVGRSIVETVGGSSGVHM
ncbi:MAG: hypothetical protein ABWY25_04305, partial [Paenisporosarcina sp.]